MKSDIEMTDRMLTTARLLEKSGDIFFSNFGMTTRSYEILSHISHNICTTGELAHKMQSTQANITHKTKALEENGYIERTIGNNDKRVWNFSLTAEGEKVLKHIRLFYEEATKLLYSKYTDKEKRLIADFLKATEEHLEFLVKNEQHVTEFVSKIKNTKG